MGAVEPLSKPLYVGISIGMVGERIFRDAPALLLLLFMTDFLNIPAALAGVAVFVPKLLVVFFDPMVGALSDRLNTRWGQRRPLMLIGTILSAPAFICLFWIPHLDSAFGRAAYISFMLVIAFAVYALYSVPYFTLISELGRSALERTKLMSMRVVFMAVGLALGAFAGGLVEMLGGGLPGYRQMAVLFAAICLLTMSIPVFVAPSNSAGTTVRSKPVGLRQQFAIVSTNYRYLTLLSVGFSQKLAEGIGYGSMAYYFAYCIHRPLAEMALVVLAATGGQIAAQPFWVWASKRWSRGVTYTIGAAGYCICATFWLLVTQHSPRWLVIAISVPSGVFGSGLFVATLSMLSDLIALESKNSGVSREGIYSGVWLAGEKVAFALGALVVGVVLAGFGFRETSAAHPVIQSHSAVMGITFAFVGLHTAVYWLSILVVRVYSRAPRPWREVP